MDKEKLCTKCKEIKSISEYGKHKLGKDGLRSTCKKCHNEEGKLWRHSSGKDKLAKNKKAWGIKNQARIRETSKQWKEKNKEKVRDQNREYMRRRRLKYPDKVRVMEKIQSSKRIKTEKTKGRTRVNNAIQQKIIVRPFVCSQCGGIKRITAHHVDYSRPLDVMWLCYECHGLEHRKV